MVAGCEMGNVLSFEDIKNPPLPNDLLSKGWILADITASLEASDKTAVFIVLKQRSNSGDYGQV